ncbi:hypothetical protein M1567_02820 [Candidatus Marsarchaeota archaeon]|nr:hypothetical protein [Candidatus Marsarchaeota archaeon]
MKDNGSSKTLRLNLVSFGAITAAFMLTLDVYSMLNNAPGALTPLSYLFGIAYTAYLISFSFLHHNKKFARWSTIFAIASICALAAALLSFGSFNNGIALLGGIYPLIVIYAIAVPTMVAILLGFYIIKAGKFPHAKPIAIALFVGAIALFIVYQLYIFGYKGIGSDDEMLIAYYALHSMLAGHNPYLFNSASILKSNATQYGFTLLTNNTVISRLDYPALFMLAGLPFYSVFSGSPAEVLNYGNSSGYLVMFLISLFVFGIVAGKRSLGNMKIMAPALFVFLLYSIQIVSFQYSIAIILLILTMKYIDSRYIFVLLGIAASLQELLWVPTILVLTYIAVTKGLKKAGRLAVYSALIFFLINGYFIAMGPSAYISQVFKPLDGNLIPFYLTPISSIVQAYANIPLSGFSILFYIMLALAIAITAYSGNKLTIFTGMFLSYLALDHSLIVYFMLPIAVIASAFVMDIRLSERSKLREWLKSRNISDARAVASAALVFYIALIASVAYMHGSYVREFGVSAYSQHISIIGNSIFDNVSFKSAMPGSQNVYLLGFYYLRNSLGDVEGLSVIPNRTITNSSCTENCTITGYMNTNLVTLHSGYNRIYITVPPNATAFYCAVYKNGFYYLCPPIFNNNPGEVS